MIAGHEVQRSTGPEARPGVDEEKHARFVDAAERYGAHIRADQDLAKDKRDEFQVLMTVLSPDMQRARYALDAAYPGLNWRDPRSVRAVPSDVLRGADVDVPTLEQAVRLQETAARAQADADAKRATLAPTAALLQGAKALQKTPLRLPAEPPARVTVDDVRAQISTVRAEADGLAAIRCTRAEADDVLAAWARNAEAEGLRTLRAAVAGVGVYGTFDDSCLHVTVPAATQTANLGPILAALLGADRLAALLGKIADDEIPEGLPRAERAQRLKELAADLDRLELAEEALICASETTGAPILRRVDARPEVVFAKVARAESKPKKGTAS
jgi:hypothetical protein